MRKPSMGIAAEGAPYLWLSGFTTVVFGIWGWWILSFVFFLLTFFIGHFFRDPDRYGPEDARVAVSPADGKVVDVGPAADPFTGETRTRVCVFMNVFDAHINRMPLPGTLKRLRYVPGKFINASLDKASEDNERMLLHFAFKEESRKAAQGEFTLVQIAGLVARRIACWGEPGDFLKRSDRFGLIRFGSRVDFYLPGDYDPLVSPGDRVAAGETPVAVRKSG